MSASARCWAATSTETSELTVHRDLGLTRRMLLAGIGGMAALAASPWRPALAAQAAKQLTEEDRADLKRVEEYLNGIRTMQARFQQFSPNAGLAFGNIYMRRPGQLRVEY